MTTRAGLGGALMVCGTASGAGKSFLTTGLCRALARRGLRVAPFKALNMSNHSSVTRDGAEIARAQWAQAVAAGVEPEAAMNPVLLKPSSDRCSHVILRGVPAGTAGAHGWGERAPALLDTVCDALADLRARHDVVIVEGAGSPAEINLAERDIANLALAEAAGVPAVLVGDIDRGGWFAACVGTLALLPTRRRALVHGFVANRMRGERSLLDPGIVELEHRTGVPTLGVVPFVDHHLLEREDSLDVDSLAHEPDRSSTTALDVALIRLPRLANVADVEPLLVEPAVRLRVVAHAASLGRPDLVVLPGTRATVADLAWLRDQGLDRAIAESDADVLGICGGYQMLGQTIDDGVESRVGLVDGLGRLAVHTRFATQRVQRRRRGWALGADVEGFELRHGEPTPTPAGWLELADEHGTESEGAVDGRWRGTSLHGLLDSDGLRRALLARTAARRGIAWEPGTESFAEARRRSYDVVADTIEAHVDVDRLLDLASAAAG